MAVDERVVIHVKLDADTAAGMAQLEAAMKRIKAFDSYSKKINGPEFRNQANRNTASLNKIVTAERLLEKSIKNTEKSVISESKSLKKYENGLKALTSTFKSLTKAVFNFGKSLAKIGFWTSAISAGLLSVALLAIKASLIVGRWAIQAYNVLLKALGATAATVAVGVATASAALREFAQVNLAPTVGGLRQARDAINGVYSDRLLSFFGIQGLQGAMNALAQAGVGVRDIPAAMRKLGNFTADPKQLQQLAVAFGEVSKSGKVSSEVISQFAAVNPALGAGFEEAQKQGMQGMGLLNAVLSGQTKATAPWMGQLEAVNNTLIGSFKGLLVRLAATFGRFGDVFLEPVKQLLSNLELILSKSLIRMGAALSGFGPNTLFPGIASAFETMMDWFVRLMSQNNLDKIKGWVGALGEWWRTIKAWFTDVGVIFGRFEQYATEVWNVFGPAIKEIFGSQGLGRLLRAFGDSIMGNRAAWEAFGESLRNLVESLVDLIATLVNAMPGIRKFFDFLANKVVPFFKNTLFPVLGDVLGKLETMAENVWPAVTAAANLFLPVIQGIATALAVISSLPFGNLLLLAGFLGMKTLKGAGVLNPAAVARLHPQKVDALVKGGGITGMWLQGTQRVGNWLSGRPGGAMTGLSRRARLGLAALSYVGGQIPLFTEDSAPDIIQEALGSFGFGASIGSMIPVPGAPVIGGLIAASWSTIGNLFNKQNNKKQAEGLIASEFEQVFGNYQRAAEQGGGRAAIHAAIGNIKNLGTDKSFKALADQNGINSWEDVRSQYYLQQAAELDKYNEELERFDKTLESLGDITGETTDKIELLAQQMNVDLGSAFTWISDALVRLGFISEDALTRTGQNDIATGLMLDKLFGVGSPYYAIQQDFQREQLLGDLNSQVSQYLKGRKAGESPKVQADMEQQLLESYIGIGETWGLTGTELTTQVLRMIQRNEGELRAQGFLGPNERFLGSQQIGLQASLQDFTNPAKNPAVRYLTALQGDFLNPDHPLRGEAFTRVMGDLLPELLPTYSEGAGAFGKSLQDIRFEDIFSYWQANDPSKLSFVVETLTTAFRDLMGTTQMEEQITAIDKQIVATENLTEAITAQTKWLAFSLGYESINPDGSKNTNPGTGIYSQLGGIPISAVDTRAGYAVPHPLVRRSPYGPEEVSVEVHQDIDFSVSGLGLNEAIAKIKSEVSAAMRDAVERGFSSGGWPGLGFKD